MFNIVNILITLVLVPAILGLAVYIIVLLIKVLKKYLNGSEARKEKIMAKRSLGEAIKEQRIRCNMTQEFVAERLSVSRQAVSKWENGSADPSTSNLLALAKLFGISPEDLLKNIIE